MKIDYKKAISWGVVLLIFQLFFGYFLYMNSFVVEIFNEHGDLSIRKSFESFGGVGNWYLITSIFNAITISVFIFLYLWFYKTIPGKGWLKGFIFGVVFGFVRSVPEAFNQWMVFNYSDVLIITQMLISLVGLIVFGTLMGLIFDGAKVIQLKETHTPVISK